MKSKEFLIEGPKTVWYHGSRSKITQFTLDALGTGSGADEYGPGVYLTNNIDDAKMYGGYIHTVEASQIKRKLLTPTTRTLPNGIKILINASPDRDDSLSNWDENLRRALDKAVSDICEYRPTYIDAMIQTWADFYSGNSKLFLEMVSSARFGYDGYERMASSNIKHFICWNPTILRVVNIDEKT